MTGQAPGQFTREQLWRGALHSWLAFMALMLATFFVALVVPPLLTDASPALGAGGTVVMSLIFVFYAAVIGGVVSLVVTLVGVPVAALFALALRRVRGLAWHVTAFGAFGVTLGLIVAAIWGALGDGRVMVNGVALASACLCGLATAYGRWRASRDPRVRSSGPHADPDADAEDRLSARAA